MKIYHNEFPWDHWIIDDFLDQHSIAHLQSSGFKAIAANEQLQKPCEKTRLGPKHLPDTLSYKIMERIVKELMPKVLDKIDYVPPRNSIETWPGIEAVITTKGYKYPPHCDGYDKVWSFITYVGPEKSVGTILMSDMHGKDEVEAWQVFFICS